MLFKSLFLLVFANLFNQAYQLQQIKCPKWVPGTNQIEFGATVRLSKKKSGSVLLNMSQLPSVKLARLNGLRIILNSRRASNSSMEYLLFLDETG